MTLGAKTINVFRACLNSQSVLRNDVTSYCLARCVWDLFWVEFVFFFIVLALGLLSSFLYLSWRILGPRYFSACVLLPPSSHAGTTAAFIFLVLFLWHLCHFYRSFHLIKTYRPSSYWYYSTLPVGARLDVVLKLERVWAHTTSSRSFFQGSTPLCV